MKRALISITVLLVATSVASLAFASTYVDAQIGDTMKIETWPQGQAEGPFKVTISNASGVRNGSPFLTFCVESQEYFYNGDTFKILGLTTGTVNSNRSLTGYSAWVYNKFLSSGITLSSSPAVATLNAYQYAIWSGIVDKVGGAVLSSSIGSNLYSEYGYANGHSSSYGDLNGVTAEALGIAYDQFTRSDWDGQNSSETAKLNYTGDIKVINVHGEKSGSYEMGQDQLIPMLTLDPTGSLTTPEPASLAIWGLGSILAAGMVCVRRRKANRA